MANRGHFRHDEGRFDMRASLSAAVMPCAMSTYEMNGRKVGFLWHRHFSSMTIDQNEQTLSGVTDPLFVVVRLDLAGGAAEAKGQVPLAHHCHCQCRRHNCRHFARSMADHRLPRQAWATKPRQLEHIGVRTELNMD